MCKRLLYPTVFLVMVLMLAGNTSAATILWDGGGSSNRLWSLPANWNPDGVPTIADSAQLNVADANCLIDSSVTAVCLTLDVGYNLGPCYLNMTGGSLKTGGNLSVGRTSATITDTNGIFIMSGGDVNVAGSDGRLWIGYGGSSGNKCYGTFIISNGVVNISGTKIELGKNPTGDGRMYIKGGTLNLIGSSADFEIAKYGNATIVMTGGDVNVVDAVKFVGDSTSEWTGSAHMDLHGGTIRCNNFYMGSKSTMDITEGELRIVSAGASELSTVQQYVANGWITAYSGAGFVDATLSGSVITVTGSLGDPNLAWNPSPGDGTTVEWTSDGPELDWTASRYAASHDVYFGNNEKDVNDATNMSPEFEHNQVASIYTIGPLNLGETYYWRIDEVNDSAWAPAGSPWKGPVWRFTTSNYIVVDNFESYGNANTPGPPPPAGSRMWYTWKDGYGWNVPSTVAGNGTGSIVDPNYSIVNGGSQSLRLTYYNDGSTGKKYYSEIIADTSNMAIGKDWTKAGVKALVLWFYGRQDNDANEQMYVKLNGVKKNYNDDMNNIKEASWHEWNIDMSEFGIDLSNVTTMAIGLGNETNTTTRGGWGVVYFDDIRLYLSRCVPSVKQPGGDLDDDCDVDYADLVVMLGDGLEKDYTGVGSDGVLKNFPSDNSQWVNDVERGRCLQLDGANDWVDIDDNQFSNFHNKTISLWVKVRAYPSSSAYIFMFANAGTTPYRIYILTRTDGVLRVRFVEDYTQDFIAGTDTWRHLAFVLRDTDDGLCTGEFYGDGVLIDRMFGQPRHSGGASGVNLGSASDGSSGFANAVYDDFRVYDYALSENEIANLAGLGGAVPTGNMLLHYKFDEVSGSTAKNSSTYVFNRPLISAAELYEGEAQGSRIINFKDFAVFSESWLEEQLWP